MKRNIFSTGNSTDGKFCAVSMMPLFALTSPGLFNCPLLLVGMIPDPEIEGVSLSVKKLDQSGPRPAVYLAVVLADFDVKLE